MPVEWVKGGLRLSGSPLWFDARRKADVSFVSHAHTDHIARHARAIGTTETLTLMQHRVGTIDDTVPLRYGERFELDGLSLELFPAGHVLGAAQVRVTRPDGHRLVYTGDFSPGRFLTARQAETPACDTLVVESTFGHPKYRFPPRDAVYDEVALWCRRQLERGVRPVLLAYSLGKSQETIQQLASRGLSLVTHESIHAISALYTSLGVPIDARCWDGAFRDGEVGLFPPFNRHRPHVTEPIATAVLTGWALEPWGARRSGADVAFPVSDHADYPSLVDFARATGAREVITLFGFAEELAAGLRKEGLFARAVSEKVQLDFFGAAAPPARKAARIR
ncbi:MAG: MBL fold metallo-hydrolase [Myxococcaceae bacterium]|jgi:putative mRNA 3-end processing factor|nr:MBL fold metallo-hydrolase [Myxococcaceae bacterium]